jgi:hypothetical protein
LGAGGRRGPSLVSGERGAGDLGRVVAAGELEVGVRRVVIGNDGLPVEPDRDRRPRPQLAAGGVMRFKDRGNAVPRRFEARLPLVGDAALPLRVDLSRRTACFFEARHLSV